MVSEDKLRLCTAFRNIHQDRRGLSSTYHHLILCWQLLIFWLLKSLEWLTTSLIFQRGSYWKRDTFEVLKVYKWLIKKWNCNHEACYGLFVITHRCYVENKHTAQPLRPQNANHVGGNGNRALGLSGLELLIRLSMTHLSTGIMNIFLITGRLKMS